MHKTKNLRIFAKIKFSRTFPNSQYVIDIELTCESICASFGTGSDRKHK